MQSSSLDTTAPPADPPASNASQPPAAAGWEVPGWASAGAALIAGVLVLARLSEYGIWDPWELSTADAARKLAEGDTPSQHVTLPLRAIAAAFSAFGVREWAGRLPVALSGLGLLAVTAAWVRPLAGMRAALYAALCLATTPLFILQSRQMMGATPGLLASALVMLSVTMLTLAPSAATAGPRTRLAWLSVAALGSALGAASGGVLLYVAPPVVAAALVAWWSRPQAAAEGPAPRTSLWLLYGAAGFLVAGVTYKLFEHAAGYSHWTGAEPLERPLATHETPLEQLFHSFVPWSAVLPLGFSSLLRKDAGQAPARTHLAQLSLTWAALAFAAQSISLSSFGGAPFSAPSALAVAAAIWLHDIERRRSSFWPELLILLMLTGLAIRDFALYPVSPLGALTLEAASTPDAFNPRGAWALSLGLFAALALLACLATAEASAFDPRAPYRAALGLWRSSWGHKGWLALAACTVLLLSLFGGLCWVAPAAVPVTSLGARIGRGAVLCVLALPLLVALGQWVFSVGPRLHRQRALLLLAAGICVGAYTSLVFEVELSAHLSPRVVFDRFNALAQEGEPLAQFKVEGRAATYYAKGPVEDLGSRAALIDYLAGPGRRWAALPTTELAETDLGFRRKRGAHLFAPEVDNATIALVSNEPVPGTENHNPLVRSVLREPPKVQHALHADFEGKIELLGYDLHLPDGGRLGPGQSFEITWVWRAKQRALGNYQVFVHIDGQNQRLNGDHDPVDGTYPVRLWDEGDVILDRQQLRVPATYRAGTYTMFVGLYRGQSRLEVTDGPHDKQNRVRAGVIRLE